jgi:hypothetical protein
VTGGVQDAYVGRGYQEPNPRVHEVDVIATLPDHDGFTVAHLSRGSLGHAAHHEQWPLGEQPGSVIVEGGV